MDAAASAASVAAAANANLSHSRPQQDPPRMRSSIACWRCRRSKVKCLNNGVNTPCRACVTANRECTYPSPSVGDRSQRRDGREDRAGGMMDGMGMDTPKSSRSKPKKHTGYGASSSMRPLLDALDPSILTPQVWLDLFETWQRHYAGDLPFLHPPTFQKILRQARSAPPTPQDFATVPKPPLEQREQLLPGLPIEFLLAFLALTSKFHPTLVTHHSPSASTRASNPLLAADYYAAACKERLQRVAFPSASLNDVNLSRCQAHLMLAVHEWGSCQGLAAWSDLDAAKRYAQLLGLQYLDTAKESNALKFAAVKAIPSGQPAPTSPEDALIDEEAKRRTLWSCFAVERCMSSGMFRPLELKSMEIGAQLPCSERAFLFGEKVLTKLLIETMDAHQFEKKATLAYSPLNFLSRSKERNEDLVAEIGVREPAISRYIRALDTFNAIIQYAGAGGRLIETYPPWENDSEWHALYKAVQQDEKLPRDLTLSPANISAHHSTRTLSSFLLLHTTILLSKIILHREWIPFLAIRATAPTGPTDTESPFMIEARDDPAKFHVGFWGESAGELFETAAQLLSLLSQCAEYQALVETPLVGFAAYMVALVGIYSTHFPWMDVREHMSTNPASSTGHSGLISMWFQRDASQARKAIDLLSKFRPRLRQTSEQMQVLARLHVYYLKMKRKLRKNYKIFNPFTPGETYRGKPSLMPLRMGEEEYSILDAVLGGDLGGDTEMVDAPPVQQGNLATTEDTGVLGTPTPSTTEGAQRWPAVNVAEQQVSPIGTSNGGAPGSGGSGSGSAYPGTPSGAASIQPFTPPPMPASRPPASTRTDPDASLGGTSASTRVNWTAEQVEAWLDELETVFTSGDIVGWAEGKGWKEDAVVAGNESGWSRDWRRLL